MKMAYTYIIKDYSVQIFRNALMDGSHNTIQANRAHPYKSYANNTS